MYTVNKRQFYILYVAQ